MGNTCNNCGGDLLKCTHPQETPVKTKTITVEPEDAKPGDKVTGTYTRVKDVHVEASGILKGGAFGDHELYIVPSWGYVVVAGQVGGDWQDVTITREVPVRTRTEAVADLRVGTLFYHKASAWHGDRDVFIRTKTGAKNLNTNAVLKLDRASFGADEAPEDYPYIIDSKDWS